MKLTIETSIWNVLCFGMYETCLSIPDSCIENDMEELEGKNVEFDKDEIWRDVEYDNAKYKKDLAKFGVDYIKENLEFDKIPFKLEIVSGSIWSPREYNFRTDTLDMVIEVPDNLKEILSTELSKEWDKISKYFDKNFGSRSGFISFAPLRDGNESVESYLDRIDTEDELAYLLGMYLNYLELELNQESFYMEWSEHINESDYTSSEKLNDLYTKEILDKRDI